MMVSVYTGEMAGDMRTLRWVMWSDSGSSLVSLQHRCSDRWESSEWRKRGWWSRKCKGEMRSTGRREEVILQDGSRNLCTGKREMNQNQETLGINTRHNKSQGVIDVCLTKSSVLSSSWGRLDNEPHVRDYSEVREPKAGARQDLRPGRGKTGEQKSKQKCTKPCWEGRADKGTMTLRIE